MLLVFRTSPSTRKDDCQCTSICLLNDYSSCSFSGCLVQEYKLLITPKEEEIKNVVFS